MYSKGYGYKRCTAFWRAIEKYGWDNFTYEILAQDLTEEDAKQLEKYYIKLYDSTNPEKGYNISAGGDGFSIYDYDFRVDVQSDIVALKVLAIEYMARKRK